MRIFSKSKKPGRELINLDGTPYENRFLHPAVRPFADFISLPSAKIGVAAAFAIAAVETCIAQDTSYLAPSLTLNLVDAVTVQAVCMIVDRGFQRRYEKKKGMTVVIDKSGRYSLDQAERLKVAEAFERKGNYKGCITLVCGLLGFKPIPGIASTLWDDYAAGKLEKGDWTIVTNPPRRQSQKSRVGLWGRLTAPRAG